MGRLKECPRCGEVTLEKLKSYSHCAHCLFYQDYWRDFDDGYLDALRHQRDLVKTEEQMKKARLTTDIEPLPNIKLKGA